MRIRATSELRICVPEPHFSRRDLGGSLDNARRDSRHFPAVSRSYLRDHIDKFFFGNFSSKYLYLFIPIYRDAMLGLSASSPPLVTSRAIPSFPSEAFFGHEVNTWMVRQAAKVFARIQLVT